jgi:hypothetical protein
LDPSGENVDHHEIYCPDVANLIYKPSSESDFDSGREVFMVGQRDPHAAANQSTEEIALMTKVKIVRAARLPREANKAARKSHRGQQDDSGASDEEVEDGATSRGTTPSSTGNVQQVVTDFGIGLGHFTNKSSRLSGKLSRFTACLCTMHWPLRS